MALLDVVLFPVILVPGKAPKNWYSRRPKQKPPASTSGGCAATIAARIAPVGSRISGWRVYSRGMARPVPSDPFQAALRSLIRRVVVILVVAIAAVAAYAIAWRVGAFEPSRP